MGDRGLRMIKVEVIKNDDTGHKQTSDVPVTPGRCTLIPWNHPEVQSHSQRPTKRYLESTATVREDPQHHTAHASVADIHFKPVAQNWSLHCGLFIDVHLLLICGTLTYSGSLKVSTCRLTLSSHTGLRFLWMVLLLNTSFPAILNFTYGSLVPTGKDSKHRHKLVSARVWEE